MVERLFEIEYIDTLNLSPTRIKAASMNYSYDFRYQAPRLVFLDSTYTPVFTHDGLPDIIKSIHFIQKENSHDDTSPTATATKVSGDANIKSDASG